MRGNRFVWALLLTLATGKVCAATYYLDAIYGNDRNAGTGPASAWRSLDKVAQESRNKKMRKSGFAPGDQILFRRGQTFTSTGYPIITVAGTAAAPVSLDAWGEGDAPRLDNDGSGSYDLVFKISGNYAFLRNLAFVKSNPLNVTEHGAYLAGSGHRVTACDFSGVGIGLKLEGAGHRVDQSVFHDLTMVFADSAPDNDYGAIGVVVSKASNIEIDHNRFERLRAASPDYGFDGSAVEIFNAASDVRFHHNVVRVAAALTEVGGSVSTDVVSGLHYFHNLVLEADSVGYFHNNAGGSTYGLNVLDVRFEHNTVSKTGVQSSFLLGFGVPPEAGRFFFRNNIVEHRNSNGLFWNVGQLEHQANLYWLANAPYGDAAFALGATEVLADPLFRDAANGDYHLDANSMAVDLGLSLGYGVDLDDLPMPLGFAPDLGAYEVR